MAALLIGGFWYREIKLPELHGALLEGVTQTAAVMLLVATSGVLGLYLTEIELPQKFANWITSVSDDRIVVLMMLNLMLLVLGMVLHGAAAIILIVPIVMPLIRELEIDLYVRATVHLDSRYAHVTAAPLH